MASRLVRMSLLACVLLGCSDNGPEVPLLFVKPPTGSNGAGSIASAPGGISCTISNQTSAGQCSANFQTGASVTLTATPAAGSSFTGWGEDCAGTDPTCAVTLDESADVTAAFALNNPRRLTVSGTGTGSGTITSIPGGLSCVYSGTEVSGTCAADFADGAVVTITAAAALGTGFNAWSDDCASAGATATCDVTMSADRSASAEFVSVSFSGLMASASDAQSGLIVVNIPTASARVARTAGPGVSLSAAASDVVTVGTVRFLGGEPVTIAGTYDTEKHVLSLASGSGFDMSATFSNDAFTGTFFDAERQVGGPTALVSSPGTAPRAYCGSFAGPVSGSWNVIVAGNLATATRASDQGGSRTMIGDVDEAGHMTLVAFVGFVPDTSQTGNAVGDISADQTTITGAWADFTGETGTWQAGTADCEAEQSSQR